MNYAKKRDHNQAAIVRGLESAYCSVIDLSAVGGGCNDLLVGRNGVNYLIEIKNLEGRGLRYTPPQKEHNATWKGQKCTVTTLEEALVAVGLS